MKAVHRGVVIFFNVKNCEFEGTVLSSTDICGSLTFLKGVLHIIPHLMSLLLARTYQG